MTFQKQREKLCANLVEHVTTRDIARYVEVVDKHIQKECTITH